jgi:D-alanyl-D-alanine carboxypeptidase
VWRFVLFCAFLGAVLAVSLSDSDHALSAQSSRRDLQAALDALVAANDGPVGAIVTIADNMDTTTWTAGKVALGASAAPAPTDHMRIASLTKAFTAALALQLVAEGRLALSDTVGEWLPELPSAWHPITLEQLLRHTSGVPDFARSPRFIRAVTASPHAALSPRAILALARDDVDFAPGERYAYSNSNPVITGLMIEAASGESYSAALRERVLEPLGLRATYLPASDDPNVVAPVFRGYSPLPRADVTSDVSFGGWAWASGGLISTAEDVGSFVRAYVRGVLAHSELASERHVPFIAGSSQPEGPGTNRVGLGRFAYETPCGTVYGHTGSILGYTQFMAASADGTRSITLTISTQASQELVQQLRAVEQLAVCIALGMPTPGSSGQ